jgi:formylglycine-generating enzyme
MKTAIHQLQASIGLALLLGAAASNPAKAAAPCITNIAVVGGFPRLVIQSDVGVISQVQCLTNLSQTNWFVRTNLMTTQITHSILDTSVQRAPQNFYRVVCFAPPTNMAFIPAGSFLRGNCMGTNEGIPTDAELPTNTVYISPFCMDKYEVTEAQWENVRAWATNRPVNLAYDFENIGCWKGGINYHRGPSYPVHSVNWYDMVKWCNARSEKDGLVPAYYTSASQATIYRTGRANTDNTCVKWTTGYRLPTEAEWENAARGGLSGKRFPWGDTISLSRANYTPSVAVPYDLSYPGSAQFPDTSPVGYFAANGYGLYDMAGNVLEWCWDQWSDTYYATSPSSDPLGPVTGSYRALRGGNFATEGGATYCRVAWRSARDPGTTSTGRGFRCILPLGQP